MNADTTHPARSIEDKLADYAITQYRHSIIPLINEAKVCVSHCRQPNSFDKESYSDGKKALANSHQLDDCLPRSFTTQAVRDVIEEEFRILKNESYDPVSSAKLALVLSDRLKNNVKKLLNNRYRIVSSVVITNKSDQNVDVVSRVLWQQKTDVFESYSYTNDTLHAIGIIFLVYLE